ncbi:MAG TPA: hypothetical protein PKW75_04895 [candidate division Zixibacteria bacterium]|nr:PD40 domain-containing protein [candidate division Zixibacteria bacterium]MDD4918135.1 hypothetical protein [candidate division Zixibacteria bacterium]MDM7972078.1 hypothetical protein [candidate division Zixibacteria bacterium]HOD66144.1 hypothetical protein [candidate division Zixibacteria bacterium]HOZ07605.1 hypothetical protein [candidate division Zixibacteria bacterium]
MRSTDNRTARLLATLVAGLALAASAAAAEKLPPARAGKIDPPTGQIAFLRNGNVWIMNADGSGQQLVSQVGNADGSLSWAPDNRRIAFVRSGKIDLRGPDPNVGGLHKVYDIFIAWLDSAYANNTLWWTRLSEDLGSRGPEWSLDGSEIVFWKDMNANYANAFLPNFQICTMSPDGGKFNILRKDWQNFSNDFLTFPTANRKGQIACVHMSDLKGKGLVVFDRANPMISIDSIRAASAKNLRCIAPSWSPDDQWLAYILDDISAPQVCIATPDLKEHFTVFSPPVGIMLYTNPPSFSPDSKWLTFATSDGSVWICDITGNGARRLTPPGLDKNPAWSKPQPR